MENFIYNDTFWKDTSWTHDHHLPPLLWRSDVVPMSHSAEFKNPSIIRPEYRVDVHEGPDWRIHRVACRIPSVQRWRKAENRRSHAPNLTYRTVAASCVARHVVDGGRSAAARRVTRATRRRPNGRRCAFPKAGYCALPRKVLKMPIIPKLEKSGEMNLTQS